MAAPVFVELCAGSAAVSLRWLNARAKPPLAWQGGKRGYADAILDEMGLHPGGGAGRGEVVLVEPGPWGEAWDLWRTPQGRAGTVDRLRGWAEEDPRALWERLRRAPVPEGAEDRVAVWAVLMFWSFGCKPVVERDGGWDENGFNAVEAYRDEHHQRMRAEGREWAMRWQEQKPRRLPDVTRALQALPDLSRVTVHRGPAEALSPIPGAHVYIDPPYRGTTCQYGHDLPDPCALAARWAAAGCGVAVSEARPLPIPGWRSVRLAKCSGFGRTWSKQKDEWLTMSPEGGAGGNEVEVAAPALGRPTRR